MKIYSWNVNGIRAVQKKALFEPFITKQAPDIVCLQETKASPSQVADEFSDLFPQYQQFWHSAEKKGYAGTAIFTKRKPRAVLIGIPEQIARNYNLIDSYGDITKEGRVLTLEFEHCFVSTVYTPNAKEDLSRIPMRQAWDPAYLTYMKELELKKPVIFCGDFNVAHTENDLARPKENVGKKGFTSEERDSFEAIIKAGFVDTGRIFNCGNGHYTWWSHWGNARERNVGWRIDYILVSAGLKAAVKTANIHPDILGSDHCPVSVELTWSS